MKRPRPPVPAGSRHVRRVLTNDVALRIELAVQIVLNLTICTLIRVPGTADTLSTLPDDLSEVVGETGVIDVVLWSFGHPPINTALGPGGKGRVGVGSPKGVYVFAVSVGAL